MANMINEESHQDELFYKAVDLHCADKADEAWEIMKQIELEPETLMHAKALYGKEELLKLGLNLEPAEKAYGKNWLDR